MILVSGCSRSGTSLMMNILKTSLGEERLLGKEFPREEKEEENELIKYIRSKDENLQERIKNHTEKSKNMNPDGFYEMEWTMTGISYSMKYEKILKECKKEPLNIVKVVSPGLINSDPKYISKIIYMLRNPYDVAKSHENLIGRSPISPNINGEQLKINSPDLFIKYNTMGATWIKEHLDVPVKIIQYEDLVYSPKETLKELSEFLNEDVSHGESCVKKKLHRSKGEVRNEEEWVLANNIYECIQNEDWEGAVRIVHETKIEDPNGSPIMCTRLNRRVVNNECKACRMNSIVRDNYKKASEEKNIDWRNEPCTRDVFEQKVTIKESIEKNSWIGDEITKSKKEIEEDLQKYKSIYEIEFPNVELNYNTIKQDIMFKEKLKLIYGKTVNLVQ